MAEGYHTNNKKTPQGVTNVEVILFNHLMQKKGGKNKQSNGKNKQSNEKNKQNNGKEQTEQWKGFYFTLNGKPKDLQLKDCCHELRSKSLARNDRFCFQNSK
jgi:hypothetical protein